MITVRSARPDDADYIARMARALSVADGGKPSRFTAESFRRDGFGERAAFSTMVVEFGDEVVGYVVYYTGYDTDSATRGIYLADLYVDKNHRRLGLGRSLLTGLAAAARNEGARWMFWSVLKRNRGARRFYKKVAPELKDVIVCAAFGRRFNSLADQAP